MSISLTLVALDLVLWALLLLLSREVPCDLLSSILIILSRWCRCFNLLPCCRVGRFAETSSRSGCLRLELSISRVELGSYTMKPNSAQLARVRLKLINYFMIFYFFWIFSEFFINACWALACPTGLKERGERERESYWALFSFLQKGIIVIGLWQAVPKKKKASCWAKPNNSLSRAWLPAQARSRNRAEPNLSHGP